MSFRTVLARSWFPLALAALLLISIPALILLALNIFDSAAPVNEWLLENFDLTYQLAVPPVLAFILLLVPLAILILYFLKLKRKPLQVPSTFLWKKSIEDLHVNSLLQWLRENILLILQLLAVLIMIYGVMGFRFHGSSTRGKHYIIIIDNSASMSATDVEPTRLHWAKQEALKEIDAAEDEDHGMVIVFNSKATTLQAYTNNRAKLRDAVQRIEPTHRATNIEEALNLADSLANPVRSTEETAVRPEDEKPGEERTFVPLEQGISTTVHLYSDGRFQRLADSVLASLNSRQAGNTSVLGNLNLRYHLAGKAGADNLGIVEMNAVRWGAASGVASTDPNSLKLQVLIRVRNYRLQPAAAKLRLDVLVNGRLSHPEQKSLTLPARKLAKTRPAGKGEDPEEIDEEDRPGEDSVTFVLPAVDPRTNVVLHAYLDKPSDSFPLDDEAWLVVGRVRKARILIIGPHNPILDAFFDQEVTKKLAKVEYLSAKELNPPSDKYRNLARNGEMDLVIFDRCAPKEETDMPQANTFFINDVPPPWIRGSKELKNPYLVANRRDHPLLKYITTLWDVGVTEAFRFDPKENLGEAARKEFGLPEGDPNRRTLPALNRLIEAGGQVPVLFQLGRGSHKDVVMTFPLVNERGDLTTNWPLQPSFPLFLRNALYYLGNVSDTVREATVQPGEPMVLRPEAGVRELFVTSPKGVTDKLTRGNKAEFTYGDTELLGVYKVVRDDKGQGSFSVNLLDANESNIEPVAELRIGSDRIKAGEEERKQPRDLWKWIILLAFVLLLLEWYIYNRRVYV